MNRNATYGTGKSTNQLRPSELGNSSEFKAPSRQPSRGLHLIILIYSLLSITTFTVYGLDKLAARRGGERISERTLHLLALCGGWPGALAGQWFFRHKTRKNSFQACFWLTVLLNGALLLGWRAQL